MSINVEYDIYSTFMRDTFNILSISTSSNIDHNVIK